MEKKIGDLKVITQENGILTPHNYSAMLNGGNGFANYIYPNYPDNSSTSGFKITTNGSVLTIGKGLAKVGGVIVENVNTQRVDINSSTIGFGTKSKIYIAIKNVGHTATLVICDNEPYPIATDENTIGNYEHGTRYFVIGIFSNKNLRLDDITNSQSNNWVFISGGFYGGKTINLDDNLWNYDYLVLAYGDNEIATIDLRIPRALNNIKRGGSGIVTWNCSSANINGGNPLYRAMSLRLSEREIRCTGSTIFNASNKAIATNNGDYAITKYALIKLPIEL